MDPPRDEQTISEVTRRPILDLVSGRWSGRLDEVDFLRRLYDLDAMPSTDGRFPTAANDIGMHRIANYDWDDDWVFNDQRFNILRGTDEDFVRFIAETLHPIVRPDAAEVETLVTAVNELLEADGWHLTKVTELSGRPVYRGGQLGERATVFEEPTGWPKVDRQLQHVRQSLRQADSEEACQSIGLVCREVLISAAQATFDPSRHPALDGIEPSDTDAERMIEAVIAAELAGGGNEEARAHAKKALALARALQHKRTADSRTAALCAEATFSVVNILAVLSGRRGI